MEIGPSSLLSIEKIEVAAKGFIQGSSPEGTIETGADSYLVST
jgi:hypothetical protein